MSYNSTPQKSARYSSFRSVTPAPQMETTPTMIRVVQKAAELTTSQHEQALKAKFYRFTSYSINAETEKLFGNYKTESIRNSRRVGLQKAPKRLPRSIVCVGLC